MITRRNILKATTLGAIVGLPFTNKVYGKKYDENLFLEGSEIYLTKHGSYKVGDIVLWASLSGKIVDVNKKINSILSSYNYKTELSYSSSDKFKIKPCLEIISYLASADVTIDIHFLQNEKDLQFANPSSENAFIEEIYNKIGLSNKKGAKIISKAEDRYGPSQKHIKAVEKVCGSRMSCINAKEDRVLQVNSLIGGLVYSILSVNAGKSEVKQQIRSHFTKVYGIKDYISDQDKYRNIIISRIKI